MKWWIGIGCAVFLGTAASASAQQVPGTTPDSAAVDTTGARSRIERNLLTEIPVDEASALLRFLPGFEVVESQAWYRSRAFGLHSYVDGVPVRSHTWGAAALPPLRSLRSVAVVGTEAPVWMRGAGVMFETAAGAERLEGDVRVGGDLFAPADWNQYLTRIEAGARGPVPVMRGLSFSLDGELFGNRYRQLPDGFAGQVYLPTGIDTVIRVARSIGDSVAIVIPSYEAVEYNELPLGNSDRSDVVGTLRLERGRGSWLMRYQRTSLQAVERDLDQLYNTDLWNGRDDVAQTISLGVTHAFPFGLAGDAVISHQRYDMTNGALDPAWANTNAQPSLGIMTGALEFLAERDAYPVTDAMLLALRSGVLPIRTVTWTTIDNPLAIRRQGVQGVSQSLRLNPYGMRTSWATSGLGLPFVASWSTERRWYGRAALGRQLTENVSISAGADLDRVTVESFSLPLVDGVPRADRQKPETSALFAELRGTLAGARINAGVRAERFGSDALLPRLPGFVTFVPDSLRGDAYRLREGTEPWQERLERVVDCGGAATADARRNPVTGQPVCLNNFVPVEDATHVSPRISAEYDLGARFTARGGYASFVQNPTLYANRYTDLSSVSFSTAFPAPLDPVTETAFELGVTASTTRLSWVDVLLFRHSVDNPLAPMRRSFVNPLTGGDMFLWVMGNGYSSTTTGIEVTARQTLGRWAGLQAHVGLSSTERESNPDAVVQNDESRTDPVRAAGIVWLDLGEVSSSGALHSVLSDLTVHALASYTGGARYTRLQNVGDGYLVTRLGGNMGGGAPAGEVNAEQMPAFKQLDLRLAKGFHVAGTRARVFADVRNPFGIENVRALYAETGTTSNEIFEARAMNTLLLNNTGTGSVQDMVIDTWPGENEVNRHMLRRAEQRFGDGDGVFTVDEMIRAWGSALNLVNGPQWFTQRERELRLGVEVRF